ncbi:MAG: M48 family metalloprotease [Beijerinckiaceae bacterium]|nr:M48 family metalloprotease [Beijerinckiaceae bacterium]
MEIIVNRASRPLRADLQALVDAAPPPGPVKLRVTCWTTGSKTRARWFRPGDLIVLRRRHARSAWGRGVLAHEYAHIVDPVGSAGIWAMIRPRLGTLFAFAVPGWLVGVISTPPLLDFLPGMYVALALFLIGGGALLAGWPEYSAESRAQELRADARGAELLGSTTEVRLMLIHFRDRGWCRRILRREPKEGPLCARFGTHPHPLRRLASLDAAGGPRTHGSSRQPE